MDIKKVKRLKGDGLEIHYTKSVQNGATKYNTDVQSSCWAPPHSDFREALSGLSPFLAELCEQESDREQLVLNVECTGFTIGGSDEHEGATLIGRKYLKGNRVLNLVSPFRKWDDPNSEGLEAGNFYLAVSRVIQ